MPWRLCCLLVIAVSVFSFTPLAIPEGVVEPMLFGLPRTLWVGMLISLAYVGLTLAGALVHPGLRNDEGKGRSGTERLAETPTP